jgi:hypothetical protein
MLQAAEEEAKTVRAQLADTDSWVVGMFFLETVAPLLLSLFFRLRSCALIRT